jgi:ureidoacrylate peracid hydrolase
MITPERLGAVQKMSHREPLVGVAQKATPGRAALVVVDMQNDFCAPGGMMDSEGLDLSFVQEAAGRVTDLLAAARAAGVLVVFVRNVYNTESNSYLSDVWLEQAARRRGDSYTLRAVCAADSWEGDFYGDIRPEPGEPVVTKHRFSAFHNTDLDTVLRANDIRTMVMTGVAANVCVETTAREGFCRDYYILFVDDASAAYHPDDHAATLRNINNFFGEVVTSAELIRLWAGRAQAPADGDSALQAGEASPAQDDPESSAR